MGKNFLDKKIKDRLYDHQTPLDNEALWGAILAKQERRRGGLVWLFAGSLLLIGVSGFILFSEKPDLETKVHYGTTSNSITQIEHPQPKDVTIAQVEIAEQELSDPNNLENDFAKATEPIADVPVRLENELNIPEREKERLENITPVSPPESKVKSTSHEIKQTALAESNVSETGGTLQSKTINSLDENLRESNSIVTKLNTSTPASTSKKESNVLLEATILKHNEIKILDSGAAILTQDVRKVGLEDIKLKARRTNQIGCYDHSRKSTDISLFAYTGPEYVMRTLSTENPQEYQDLLNAREESEVVLEGVRSGLMVKYLHESGFFAKIGFEYSRIHEKLNHTVSRDSTYYIPDQVIKIEIASNGDSIVTYGPVLATVQHSTTWLNYNKFEFFSIPVLFGYQAELRKFTLAGELGITWNNKMSFSGMVLESDQQPIDNPDYYKNNIGFSITGGVALGYQLNEKFKLWATPSFKYDLNKVNHDNYPIDQKYRTVGLLAGLELMF